MSTEIVPLSDEDREIKTCALQAFQPDPKDPKGDKILAARREAHEKEANEQFNLTLGDPSEKASVGSRRQNSEPASKGRSSKTLKGNPTTKEGKEEKSQQMELRRELRMRASEELLRSAQDRIKI